MFRLNPRRRNPDPPNVPGDIGKTCDWWCKDITPLTAYSECWTKCHKALYSFAGINEPAPAFPDGRFRAPPSRPRTPVDGFQLAGPSGGSRAPTQPLVGTLVTASAVRATNPYGYPPFGYMGWKY